jgi:hypothetical protein
LITVSFTVILVPTEEDDNDDDDEEGKEEEEEDEEKGEGEDDDEVIEEDCCVAAAPSSVKSMREILGMVDAEVWSRNLEWRSSLSSSMIDSSNFSILFFLLVDVIM